MYDFPASPTNGQIFAPAGGPSWQFDGIAWRTISAVGFRSPSRTVFTASGTYTIPNGCTAYDVEVIGGGGGGGSTQGSAVAGQSACAGGGGGGGYSKKLIQVTPTILAAAKTITIGVGGTTAGGATGGPGGTSSYTDGTNTLSSVGGTGGTRGDIYNGITERDGGVGGAGSGGDVNAQGSKGGWGISMGSVQAGASNSFAVSGNGAAGPWGGAGTGTSSGGTTASNVGSPGGAAVGYGAGGGGSYIANAYGSHSNGGSGYQGCVVITEYYTPDPVLGAVPEAPNNANAYVRQALGWVVGYTKAAIDSLLGQKFSGISVRNFSNQSGTWTPNYANCLGIMVEIWGSGGGGGYAPATAASQGSAGGGGGSGGYCRKWYPGPFTSYTYVAADGGAGGGSGAGATGGQSNFGPSLVVTGGVGGNAGTAGGQGTNAYGGGVGSGSGGDVNTYGQYGENGTSAPFSFGASNAGRGAHGMMGNGSLVLVGSANGNPGTGYGAGGTGGCNGQSQAGAKSGGKGAPALIVVTEYY